MGGGGRIVEADETEIARLMSQKTPLGGRKRANNKKFVSLVERDGKVRSAVIDGRNMGDVRAAVRANLDPDSVLHTDGAQFYKGMMPLGRHESVDHDKMFSKPAKGNKGVGHCNTAEGYFSIVKRGIVGTFHHVSPAHLPRYLNEFDFRMNTRKKLGIDGGPRRRSSRQRDCHWQASDLSTGRLTDTSMADFKSGRDKLRLILELLLEVTRKS